MSNLPGSLREGKKVGDSLQSEQTGKDDTGTRALGENNSGGRQSPVAAEPISEGKEGESHNKNPKEQEGGEGDLGNKSREGEGGDRKREEENKRARNENSKGESKKGQIHNKNPEEGDKNHHNANPTSEESRNLPKEKPNDQELGQRNPNFATEDKDNGLKRSGSSSSSGGSVSHSKRRPSLQNQEAEDEWVEALKTLKRWSPRIKPLYIIIMSLTLQAGGGLVLTSVLINWSINWMWPPIPAQNLTPDAGKIYNAVVHEILAGKIELPNKDVGEIYNAVVRDIKAGKIELPNEYAGNIYEAVVRDILAGKIELPNKVAEELRKYLPIEEYKEAMDKLKENYTEELKIQVSSLNSTYEVKLHQTTQSLHSEFAANMSKTLEQCQANISKTKEEVMDTVKKEQEKLSQLSNQQDDLDKRLKLEPERMEIRGFMKIETFGPILMIVGLVEIVTMLCLCSLCTRNWTGGARNPAAAQSQANGSAMQARQQERAAVPLIRTSNANIAVIVFRNSDEDRCEQWSKIIVDPLASRPQIVTHVINSIQDVNDIPACRAALVFVDPDEREMLIEDERHHIGQGLRRCAVQRLMDSGVEVFVVIFNDKNSETLDSQLFNRRLGQINEHKQLMELKKRKRIISIKKVIHQHQINHLVAELNPIFS